MRMCEPALSVRSPENFEQKDLRDSVSLEPLESWVSVLVFRKIETVGLQGQ